MTGNQCVRSSTSYTKFPGGPIIFQEISRRLFKFQQISRISRSCRHPAKANVRILPRQNFHPINSIKALKKMKQMYYRSGTCGRCCNDGMSADAGCTYIRWQHFSPGNDHTAAILKALHRLKNPTLSLNKCIFTWTTVPPDFIPIRLKMTKPLAF